MRTRRRARGSGGPPKSLGLALLAGLAPVPAAAAPRPADIGPAPAATAHRTSAAPATAGQARVAVVGLAQSEITARLVAELRFLGLSPEVLPPPTADDPQSLTRLAREAGVAAAIRVDVHAERIEIWVADRMTGKLVARALVPSPGPEDPREVAVRSVELLRASLAELEQGPAPPEAEVAAPAPVKRVQRPARPRLGLFAGATVGGGPGGVPVAAHARVRLRYMPHPNLGVVLAGTAPLHAAEVRASEGTARLRAGWIAAGLRAALRRPDATLVPDLSAMVGAALVGMAGVAAPPYAGARTLVADAIMEGSAGLELALSPRIRARGEAAVGVCARTIRVRFSGRPVATWCRPHALGSLGLGVVF